MPKGKIYLLPMLLAEGSEQFVLAPEVKNQILSLRCFIVENLKTARRYLRKLDPTFDIDGSKFYILNKRTELRELNSFIQPAKEGTNIGILSEAGVCCVADPGSSVVSLAHENKLEIMPLVGPSSILLALMGSGFNGQHFEFLGYLKKEKGEKIKQLKNIEKKANSGCTQIFMETPFRNGQILDALFAACRSDSKLCIASNITAPNQIIKTKTIGEWKKSSPNLDKIPTIFVLGR